MAKVEFYVKNTSYLTVRDQNEPSLDSFQTVPHAFYYAWSRQFLDHALEYCAFQTTSD